MLHQGEEIDIEKTDLDRNFERVEIFLRVEGRLPVIEGDKLTQEILDKFCTMYEKGILKQGMLSLEYLYNLIKSGDIKALKRENAATNRM